MLLTYWGFCPILLRVQIKKRSRIYFRVLLPPSYHMTVRFISPAQMASQILRLHLSLWDTSGNWILSIFPNLQSTGGRWWATSGFPMPVLDGMLLSSLTLTSWLLSLLGGVIRHLVSVLPLSFLHAMALCLLGQEISHWWLPDLSCAGTKGCSPDFSQMFILAHAFKTKRSPFYFK